MGRIFIFVEALEQVREQWVWTRNSIFRADFGKILTEHAKYRSASATRLKLNKLDDDDSEVTRRRKSAVEILVTKQGRYNEANELCRAWKVEFRSRFFVVPQLGQRFPISISHDRVFHSIKTFFFLSLFSIFPPLQKTSFSCFFLPDIKEVLINEEFSFFFLQ